MEQTPENIANLIFAVLKGNASPSEREELDNWIAADPENRLFAERVLREDYIPEVITEVANAERRTSELLANADVPVDSVQHATHKQKTRFLILRRFVPYAAAVFLLLLIGSYFWLTRDKNAIENTTAISQVIDIQPGGNKAMLTLSGGKTIVLDSAGTGTIARQGNTHIVNAGNGQLIYHAGENTSDAGLINTLSTPRGGQYRLCLQDGTKVWLNAASSISYPVAFNTKERKVKITGEAYFEVAKNPAKPFLVDVDGKEIIEVLGTHFNINSYPEENSINTTLLEGRVKIQAGVKAAVLLPGQQAQLSATQSNQDIHVTDHADITKITAWKNGLFNFDGAGVAEVMRELSRWYDIDVSYQGKIPDVQFIGKVGRGVSLSAVLEALKGNGVHFKIENNRQLILLP